MYLHVCRRLAKLRTRWRPLYSEFVAAGAHNAIDQCSSQFVSDEHLTWSEVSLQVFIPCCTRMKLAQEDSRHTISFECKHPRRIHSKTVAEALPAEVLPQHVQSGIQADVISAGPLWGDGPFFSWARTHYL